MQQVVNFQKYIQNPKKKSNKKPDLLDKQVLNLIGGMIPVKLIQPESKLIHPISIWTLFSINKQKTIQVWTKNVQQTKHNFHKFNQQIDLLVPQENQLKKLQNQEFTKQQLKYLFDMLQTYSLNFIVVADRYQFKGKNRDVQELKSQYFKILQQIEKDRGIETKFYDYNQQYQRFRKNQIQKTFLRGKNVFQEEKRIIEQLKKIQILTRKEEREYVALKKSLKLNAQQQVLQQNFQPIIQKLIPTNQRLVFTRGYWMQKALPLPAKVNSRLLEVLQGLGVADKVMGIQYHQYLFDQLRKQILMMFSLQKFLKKRKNVLKKLQQDKQRKKKINQQIRKKQKN